MLEIKTTVQRGIRCLNLTGELDLETVGDLERSAEVDKGDEWLKIDLAGVYFVDSTGLRGLWQTRDRCQQKGVKMQVINISPEIDEVLRLVGMVELIQGQETGEDDKGSFSAPEQNKWQPPR